MAPRRELEVVVYGDSHRVYRPGDKVEGMVFFVPTTQQHVQSLKLEFSGTSITTTTRPQYARSPDGRPPVLVGLKKYEGEARLFKFERILLENQSVNTRKHSWSFQFTFPTYTQDRCPKWAQNTRFSFSKQTHALPPSFQAYTDESGGEATISYRVGAVMSFGRGEHKSNKTTFQTLRFYNDSRSRSHVAVPALKPHLLKEQRWRSSVLRPKKHTLRQKVRHVVTQDPTLRTPCIGLIPTMHCPESISPQQDIKVALGLQHVRPNPAVDPKHVDCSLQNLTVSITTYNSTLCEGGIQPDITQDRRKCVTRRNMNTPVPADGTPISLVSTLRLNNDAECIASFSTFTIARSYTLDVEVTLKCGPKTFVINSSTPLEILPGTSPSRPRMLTEEPRNGQEQLPAYEPRPVLPSYRDSMASMATLTTVASSSTRRWSGYSTEGDASGTTTPLTLPMTPESGSVRQSWYSGY